jgi:hypothetical protein
MARRISIQKGLDTPIQRPLLIREVEIPSPLETLRSPTTPERSTAAEKSQIFASQGIQRARRHLKAKERRAIRERRTARVVSETEVHVCGIIPNERGREPPGERAEALLAQRLAYAVHCRRVLLAVRGREAVGLQARLDHVDREDDTPELCAQSTSAHAWSDE